MEYYNFKKWLLEQEMQKQMSDDDFNKQITQATQRGMQSSGASATKNLKDLTKTLSQQKLNPKQLAQLANVSDELNGATQQSPTMNKK
jgi:hypothetical protein